MGPAGRCFFAAALLFSGISGRSLRLAPVFLTAFSFFGFAAFGSFPPDRGTVAELTHKGLPFHNLHAEFVQRSFFFDARRAGRNINAFAAAFAAAQHNNLVHLIGFGRFGRIIQPDGHSLSDQIHSADVARAVGRLDKGIVFGHPGLGVLIGMLLVFEAAHKAAAGTGDFGGVQTEILRFGHFDGHGLEILQKPLAAEGLATDTQAAQHFRLVAHANLAQLDAGVEHAGQIFDQFAKIHPSVGSEEKDDLVALKTALHVHQLHFQLVGRDLLLAHNHGFFFPLAVFLRRALVLFAGNAAHRAQGLDHCVILHRVVGAHTGADFGALSRFHHHLLALRHRQALRIKKIGFAAAAEADADYFNQWDTSLNVLITVCRAVFQPRPDAERKADSRAASAPSIWPTPTLNALSSRSLRSISIMPASCSFVKLFASFSAISS